jgi:YVTN family beta-propeller protein
LKRAAFVLSFLLAAGLLLSCGGPSSGRTTSGLNNRVFITNSFTGQIAIVNGTTDEETFFTVPPGGAGTLGSGPTFMVLFPDKKATLVFDAGENAVTVVDNTTEGFAAKLTLPGFTHSMVINAQSTFAWAATPNVSIAGQPVTGAVQVINLNPNVAAGTTTTVTTNPPALAPSIPVPRAHYLAVNNAGTKLLVFSDLSDNVSVIDTASSAVTTISGPGLDRPVAGFFSADDSKAYVLNCGAECGGAASPGAGVTVLDMTTATPTVGTTVPLAAASVGLVDGANLFVAGTCTVPVAAPNLCHGLPSNGVTNTVGAFTVVNLTNMTAGTPVAIGDGYHTHMALGSNSKLFIGARICTNMAGVANSGCLSIVDTTTQAAVVPAPNCSVTSPQILTCGDVTGLQPIPNRTVVYVVQGGEVVIYDTTTNALSAQQIDVVGKAEDAKFVD